MAVKGQMFSMIAVLISVLLIMLFSSSTYFAIDRDVPLATAEVNYVNVFVGDIDSYADDAIKRSSHRILQHMVTYSSTDAEQEFLNCFEGKQPSSCDDTHSFISIFDYVLDTAADVYDLTITSDEPVVTFKQIHPYELQVTVSMFVTVKRYDVEFQKHVDRKYIVSILGFPDPLDNGRIIQIPSFDDRFTYIGSFKGDYDKIESYALNNYYFIDENAPSFLNMLEGSFELDVDGIATFVQQKNFELFSLASAKASFNSFNSFSFSPGVETIRCGISIASVCNFVKEMFGV